jgi:hypothetical protein
MEMGQDVRGFLIICRPFPILGLRTIPISVVGGIAETSSMAGHEAAINLDSLVYFLRSSPLFGSALHEEDSTFERPVVPLPFRGRADSL